MSSQKKDKTFLLDLVTYILQNDCKNKCNGNVSSQKKRGNNAGCAIVSYQCFVFNCIQVGVLEQLSDGQILMKFLYTAQEKIKGFVFSLMDSLTFSHVCFQECSFQVFYEHVKESKTL